jgi:hypothetical protein
MEYYVWNTQSEAQSALDYINNLSVFPIIGKNAKTGEECPNKQQTTAWTDEVLERTDGKWCFVRIPSARLDVLGISAGDLQSFLDTHNPTIETYQESWFPEPSE